LNTQQCDIKTISVKDLIIQTYNDCLSRASNGDEVEIVLCCYEKYISFDIIDFDNKSYAAVISRIKFVNNDTWINSPLYHKEIYFARLTKTLKPISDLNVYYSSNIPAKSPAHNVISQADKKFLCLAELNQIDIIDNSERVCFCSVDCSIDKQEKNIICQSLFLCGDAFTFTNNFDFSSRNENIIKKLSSFKQFKENKKMNISITKDNFYSSDLLKTRQKEKLLSIRQFIDLNTNEFFLLYCTTENKADTTND